MAPRALGALFALVAAIAFAVSIATSAWWAGHPVVEGRAITAKDVHVGLLGAEGCNTGGDGSCEPVELGTTYKLATYGELALVGLTAILALALAISAWTVGDRRKGLARTTMILAVLAAAGGGIVLALGPAIKASQRVDVPIGWGLYLFGGALAASFIGGAIARKLEPEPLRLKPGAQHAPPPRDVREALQHDSMLHPGSRPSDPRLGQHEPAPRESVPLFNSAPQLRPLYDPMNAGVVPAPPHPALPTRAPTPLPYQAVKELTDLPTPYPVNAPDPFAQTAPAPSLRDYSEPFGPPPDRPARQMSSTSPPPMPPMSASPASSSSSMARAMTEAYPPPKTPAPSRSMPPTNPPPSPSMPATNPPPSPSRSMPATNPPPRPGSPSSSQSTSVPATNPPPSPGSPSSSQSMPVPPTTPPRPKSLSNPPRPAPPTMPPIAPRPNPPTMPPRAVPPGPKTSTMPPPAQGRTQMMGAVPPPAIESLPARGGKKVTVPPPAKTPTPRPSNPTLAHAVPPMPTVDNQPAPSVLPAERGERASTEADDRLEEGMRVTEAFDATGESTDIGAVPSPPDDAPVDATDQTKPPESMIERNPKAATPLAPAPVAAPEPEAPKIPITTAPSTLPPPKKAAVTTSGPTPACPQCEAPMAWVDEHLRFYCKSCRMYF